MTTNLLCTIAVILSTNAVEHWFEPVATNQIALQPQFYMTNAAWIK